MLVGTLRICMRMYFGSVLVRTHTYTTYCAHTKFVYQARWASRYCSEISRYAADIFSFLSPCTCRNLSKVHSFSYMTCIFVLVIPSCRAKASEFWVSAKEVLEEGLGGVAQDNMLCMFSLCSCVVVDSEEVAGLTGKTFGALLEEP